MAQTLQRGSAVTQSGDDRSDSLQRDTERLRQGAEIDGARNEPDGRRNDRSRDR